MRKIKGIQIKDKRIEIGMTGRELSQRMGVSGPSVVRWEHGIAWPSADKLPKLASILGCTIDDLFEKEGER